MAPFRPWIPGDYSVLGCDGMGRSETREMLRRHFEVDAQCIAVAALYRLHKQGKLPAKKVARFYQIDHRLDTIDLLRMSQNTPLFE